MKKKLPIKLNPGNTTDCFIVYLLTILMTDERYLPWYVERFIELEMGIFKGKPVHDFWMYYYEYITFDKSYVFDEVLDIKRFMYKDKGNIVPDVIEAINNSQYVMLGVDCFYVWDGETNHGYHECLIHGYDEEKNEFYYVDIEYGGWVEKTVSFTRIAEGFHACINDYNNYHERLLYMPRFHMPAFTISPNQSFNREPNLMRIFTTVDSFLRGSRHDVAGMYPYGPGGKGEYFESILWKGINIYKGIYEELYDFLKNNTNQDLERKFMIGMKKLIENKEALLHKMQYLHIHRYIELEDPMTEGMEKLIVIIKKAFTALGRYHKTHDENDFLNAMNMIKDAEEKDVLVLGTIRDLLAKSTKDFYGKV